MPHCALGLGGNLGNVRETFARALAELQRGVGPVQRVSRLYRTTPVGRQSGAPFLNAAALLDTDLDPLSVLQLLHHIEHRLGRIRSSHWGPRTLDLDLLLYDDVREHSDELNVPHPGCLYRRFVLDPLAEVAPEWRHPETGLTIVAMREQLLRRPLSLLMIGGDAAARQSVSSALTSRFADLHVLCSGVTAGNARTLISWRRGARHTESGDPAIAFSGLALNISFLAGGDLETPVQLVVAMLDEPQPEGEIAPVVPQTRQ